MSKDKVLVIVMSMVILTSVIIAFYKTVILQDFVMFESEEILEE